MARTDPAINLRIPADLKLKVEQAAREAGRSTNAEIVFQLQSALARPSAPDARFFMALGRLQEAVRAALGLWEIESRTDAQEEMLRRHMREVQRWHEAVVDAEARV